MSAARSTEELVARLADDLAPVRPVPTLRRQALAVGATVAVTAAIVAGWLGLHPLATIARGAISAALLGALALAGAAGIALGLASRIPGRERVVRAAAGGVGVGGLAAAALAIAHAGSGAEPTTVAHTVLHSLDCTTRSLLLALPCGVLAIVLARRGAPWRAAATGLGLAAGAVSTGALLVHVSCPSPDAWHWLCAHALLPWLAGVPMGLAAGALLAGLDRRSRPSRARAAP